MKLSHDSYVLIAQGVNPNCLKSYVISYSDSIFFLKEQENESSQKKGALKKITKPFHLQQHLLSFLLIKYCVQSEVHSTFYVLLGID